MTKLGLLGIYDLVDNPWNSSVLVVWFLRLIAFASMHSAFAVLAYGENTALC